MMNRNIWFNFAQTTTAAGKSPTPGIRPTVDKLSRFNMVVPWFKAGKMFFPEEMKQSQILQMGISQIRLTTSSGIKGKDDFLDTVSMLGYLAPWRPSDAVPVTQEEVSRWEEVHNVSDESGLASYIV
jgi:hypothetical protein